MQITRWLKNNEKDFCFKVLDELRDNPRRKPYIATREHDGSIQYCVKDDGVKMVKGHVVYTDNGEAIIKYL